MKSKSQQINAYTTTTTNARPDMTSLKRNEERVTLATDFANIARI
jgi:hypothetical protein